MSLVTNALFVITDSGGLQEETTYLGVNCLTLRETTERPITIDQGTNSLVKLRHLIDSVERIIAGDYSKGTIPYLWDGKTAMRVAKSLYSSLLNLNGNWVHASHYIKK
jgi:UDP-N-acetylglucosamine 2-epimerase (non-hydrolysing)